MSKKDFWLLGVRDSTVGEEGVGHFFWVAVIKFAYLVVLLGSFGYKLPYVWEYVSTYRCTFV